MRSAAEGDAPPSDEQQPLTGKLSFPPSALHDEYGWMESPPEYPITERGVDVGLVGGWASDFDMLLSDPIGIKAFTDFLRKEFSSENLQFFLAVQEFKKLTSQSDIEARAREIYDNFVSPSAPEPVNLDSKARKLIETAMENGASPGIFALAEKQIYHLMKFDSYHRFLKSDIYKECSFLESKGKRLPYETSEDAAEQSRSGEASGSASCADGSVKSLPKSKRRSIIPWARIKNSINNKAASISSMPSKESSFKKPLMMRKITNSITKIRSKSLDDHITNHIKHHETHSSSMDKAVMENQQSLNLGLSRNSLVPNSSDSIDLSEHNNVFSPSPDSKEASRLASLSNESSESHSSPVHQAPAPPAEGSSKSSSQPTSSSFNHNCNRDNCHLLRIVFPDRSQTVVPSTPDETLDKLVQRLIEKRGLNCRAFEVYATGNEKHLNLNTNTNTLGCTELRVERRALFQLDLPNGDVLGIKCHPSKTCSEVLRPLMYQNGFKPEYYVLTLMATGAPVTGSELVDELDGHRITVSLSEDLEEWGPNFTNIPVALTLCTNKAGEDELDTTMIDQSALDDVTVTHSVAYHNVGHYSGEQSKPINLSDSAQIFSPGDDTKSDEFLRELVKSAQYVPSPPRNEPAVYLPRPSQPFQQECTYSVAYGIIQPRIDHDSHQGSSESSPPKPVRRHHSTATYQQGASSSHQQSTPVTNTRPKASHLRELQNHRHFQSYHSGPYHMSTDHSEAPSYQSSPPHYPIDLNSTADEMMLLGQVSHQSSSSGPINTSVAVSGGAVEEPPPLPPKNTMTTVMSERAAPPRPPPLSTTSNMPTSHQPYLPGSVSRPRPSQPNNHDFNFV